MQVVKFFSLNEKILDELKTIVDGQLTSYISSHKDNDSKNSTLYYIEQDLKNERIKVGDDLPELLLGRKNRG